MSTNSNLPSLSTMIASVTAGLAGTLVYNFLRNKVFVNSDTKENERQDKNILHLEVPRETVAYVVGRNGSNIKSIESKTCTSISFIDPGTGPNRLCVIRGTSQEDLQSAKDEMLKSVEEFAQLETSEIFVSEKVIAYLAANGNQKMKDLSLVSKARIYVYSVREKPNSLLVRGTFNQIEAVRNLLKQLVEEEPIKQSSSHQTTAGILPKPKVVRSRKISTEKLEATSSDGFAEVMVSMVESPHKFYVQKAGPLSKELDRLIADMTDFYKVESNRTKCATFSLRVDGLVAVMSEEDDCWYRGRVVSIESDQDNWDDVGTTVRVFILDFGDILTVNLSKVVDLKPEFLSMNFQAIECRLAYLKPILGKEEQWMNESAKAFETLSYCIQWKIVMARTECYKQVGKNLIPCVKLIDTNGEKDVDIATELARRELGTLVSTP